MARRRSALCIFLTLLGLFLLGTVIVLSSITYYLAIDPSAFLSELEIPYVEGESRWNASEHHQIERIPRIIHQTWKTDVLPDKWKDVSQGCRDMMPDYEYKLWTDASSRQFIEEHYSWFIDTWDGYTYNIQRADAIRYFVLHHYGGIYIDLDIGCERPLDRLLTSSVILPKTIPVGVSNDLMFAAKGHPFLAQTIHNLITFDHSWILNYPTVMFSTGPMFLSIQYGLYASSSGISEIRILPRSLYGKNAPEGEAPHSFFAHYYGSSWHADDAAFIAFLNTWGKRLMWLGLIVLLIGVVRTFIPKGKPRRYISRLGGYVVYRPTWTQRNGRWHLGWTPLINSPTQEASHMEDVEDSDIQVLLPFDDTPSSRTSSSSDTTTTDIPPFAGNSAGTMHDAARRIRNRVASFAGLSTPSREEEFLRTPVRSRRRPFGRGVLFFLPAMFTPGHSSYSSPSHQQHDLEMSVESSNRPHDAHESQWPPEKQRFATNLERAGYSSSSANAEADESRVELLPKSSARQPQLLVDVSSSSSSSLGTNGDNGQLRRTLSPTRAVSDPFSSS